MEILLVLVMSLMSTNAIAEGFKLQDLERISQLVQCSKDSAEPSHQSICGMKAETQAAFEIEFQQAWQESISAQQMNLIKKSPREKYATLVNWSRCVSLKQCRIYSFILEADVRLGPQAVKIKEKIDQSATETTTKDIVSHFNELKSVCASSTFKSLRQLLKK